MTIFLAVWTLGLLVVASLETVRNCHRMTHPGWIKWTACVVVHLVVILPVVALAVVVLVQQTGATKP